MLWEQSGQQLLYVCQRTWTTQQKRRFRSSLGHVCKKGNKVEEIIIDLSWSFWLAVPRTAIDEPGAHRGSIPKDMPMTHDWLHKFHLCTRKFCHIKLPTTARRNVELSTMCCCAAGTSIRRGQLPSMAGFPRTCLAHGHP